jgi:heat shock protein HslJ
MKKCFSVGALAIFWAVSCSSGTSPSETWDSQGVWQLQSIGSTAIPNPENYTLQFSPDGSVQVRADCNSCFGDYEANGNEMTIGPLGCTRAFCGQGSFSAEYVAALSGTSAFVRRGDSLDITSSSGTMNFRIAP